ncbi:MULTISPECIES: 2-C-methyl-D-erythritol 4-phosphate cytidylyltransferase [unclassified Undibacterium]|uniref:2-C-methyl-D-erythritol 4-phosphate cytidylyltransferase n=1 Tax=unclassified Undibacterium TaxID=2630295 RepID=UPI002AC94B8A|nr:MULTISPECIES: 2-C-methyl-D-erythritol 4-phosphate cytidylyltransferase [unclassified Undibacterium]MEB0138604.1 2-C-methyl-D-erythritol 4-phosphate cytidylyltransferase [Undibacterium sp. CCC2.1]MEB0171332.1 2-C-methyl-D-erythritol 4-phosphate cytidylyltransferase [Undibacterium sp. CCC1.1]MEB0175368.1 2-C-methyl-D-erythritol 4-phosphate cytidylyltransferase [Undibacterium sp. CCC3.4]MEB0214528.1 2-C-methyl-D-erythritol 4-phosphate cytidylyltransferase [Undibacterium sp. 5I2]WPX43098.1 2-C-
MTPALPSAARYIALIPAAGVGARMAAACPKQYLDIAGQSMLQHTVNAFLASPEISHTYVVVSPGDAYVDTQLAPAEHLTLLRCGGATRRDTVSNGLAAIQAAAADWILVHDAARPGVHRGLLKKLIDAVGNHAVGGLLALPVVDTVKRVRDGRVETIARDGLWLAQTPQMFRCALLQQALAQVEQVTDEASALEAAGYTPLLIAGHACNLKVTVPSDLLLATEYLKLHRENEGMFDEK